MVQRIEKTTTVNSAQPADGAATRETREVTETAVSASTLLARIIWYIAGILLILLAFRFILALTGANPSNSFANFIYSASHPFVAPFFSLFGYNLRYGVSRFELYTLIAMAVYAVIAWGLARLATIEQPKRTAV